MSTSDPQATEYAEIPTLLEPSGYGSSSCGYCSAMGERSSASSSKSYGMVAPQLSPRVYQHLIDRGWRRSGDYVYHPDNANTCCPQLTIRLDVMAFKPEKDKKLRHVLNRWKKFVIDGDGTAKVETVARERSQIERSERSANKPTGLVAETAQHSNTQKRDRTGSTSSVPNENRKRKKGNQNNDNKTFEFLSELHAPEWGVAGPNSAHRFEVKLVKAEGTQERFDLYDKYQQAVHGDQPGKNSMSSFKRFLCKNPLGWQKIRYPEGNEVPEHLPQYYGGYHQLWLVDSKLVAFSVIDILPGCVSSVYFVWDPDYAWASLGKLSALREAALARELQQAGVEGAGWLYMGFYIHSCQKMRYKGEYSPSYLLDPGTNAWYPLDSVRDLLDANPTGYKTFDGTIVTSQNDGSSKSGGRRGAVEASRRGADAWPSPPPPGFKDPQLVSKDVLRNLVVFLDGQLTLLKAIPFRRPAQGLEMASQLVAAVGEDLVATTKTLDRNVFMAL